MKAIVLEQYGGPEKLALQDVPKPKAGPGQVVVRVVATSLNPIDLKRASGTMRQLFPVPFPFVPGGDFSGVVDGVGQGVTDFQLGDEVFGYAENGGAYAEFMISDANKLALKPKTLTHEETASLAMVAQTASQAIKEAGVGAGQTILIHGAGGAVGNAAVQFAQQLGANVIAVARAESIDRLRSYGASRVIDSSEEAFESVAKDVDVVLDTLGGEYQQRSYAVLKPGGVLIAVSQPPSQEEAARHKVRAVMLNTTSSAESLAVLRSQIDSGQVKPFVGRLYPLQDTPQAWKDSRSEHIEGKVVFTTAD